MKSALVTGAAGFVGSNLVDRLLEDGWRVCGLDNFDDFYDPQIKRRNLAAAEAHDAFQFREADIRDSDAVEAVFQAQRFDVVVHLAALAGVRPSVIESARFVDVNLLGSAVLLEKIRQHEISKLVFASSSSVYGVHSPTAFVETDDADHPISPYAATKRAGEHLCFAHHHLHATDITCLRFFTVYGPRQRPEMAIHKFVRRIENGEPLTVFGDGTALRDFTYVADVVGGIVASVERLQGYHVYNLGSGRPVELKALIEIIEEALGKKAILDFQPQQPGDVPQTFANISLARDELGYSPAVPLERGIREFVDWFRA